MNFLLVLVVWMVLTLLIGIYISKDFGIIFCFVGALALIFWLADIAGEKERKRHDSTI